LIAQVLACSSTLRACCLSNSRGFWQASTSEPAALMLNAENAMKADVKQQVSL
jgi:hypothetical protein